MVDDEGDQELLNLPPGFRFHPTDEEIITHYLTQKVVNNNFSATAIGEVDLNKCEPWDLPKKAKMGEKEWYFFCQRDRKYPTGMRTNRATESGYWKATGKDKEIYSKGKGNQQLVGMKKTLVFYKGRAPKGEKSNWVMHEFRLDGKFSYYNFPKSAKDEWVVCRVFHKNTGMIKRSNTMTELTRMNSFVEGLLDSPSLPPLMDSPYSNNTNGNIVTNNEDEFKGTTTRNSFSYFPTNQIQIPNNCCMTNFNPTNYQTSTPPPPPSSNSNSSNNNNYQIPNSIFYSQNGIFPNANNLGSSSPLGYLHSLSSFSGLEQTAALERHLKVEQLSSNQSMVSRSQDTGLSTDLTAEISSKQQVLDRRSQQSYGDIEGRPINSVAPLSDLDSFWNY